MRIAIWGGGALGLLWAARLSPVFPDTVLFTRTQKQRDALNRRGIRITHMDGKIRTVPVRAKWSAEKEGGIFDVVFVMVKQPQLPDALDRLAPLCSGETSVWLWQNGWTDESVIRRIPLSPGSLCTVVTTEGALREGETRVRHTGEGRVWVGLRNGGRPSRPLIRMVKVLSSRGWCVELDSSIHRRMWEKLLINSVINPLTAILGVTNGKLLTGAIRPLMERIIAEGVAVAAAEGHPVKGEEIQMKVEEVCRRTSGNQSSMLQDLRRGRSTEIDYINGAILRFGDKHGIPTPVNRVLVDLVRTAEEMVLDTTPHGGVRENGITGWNLT